MFGSLGAPEVLIILAVFGPPLAIAWYFIRKSRKP
jgi:hypothetical protein